MDPDEAEFRAQLLLDDVGAGDEFFAALAKSLAARMLHAAALGGHDLADVITWNSDHAASRDTVVALLRTSTVRPGWADEHTAFCATAHRTQFAAAAIIHQGLTGRAKTIFDPASVSPDAPLNRFDPAETAGQAIAGTLGFAPSAEFMRKLLTAYPSLCATAAEVERGWNDDITVGNLLHYVGMRLVGRTWPTLGETDVNRDLWRFGVRAAYEQWMHNPKARKVMTDLAEEFDARG